MDTNTPSQPPQKLIDFNNELEALCKKYQYEVRATLQYLPQGIVPTLQAFDVSPKEEGVALNPETETQADETPDDEAKKNENPTTLETSLEENANSPVDNTTG